MPSASRSPAVRMFTGTIARRPCSGGSSSRLRSSRRRPPVAAARTTSLTVPPSVALDPLQLVEVGLEHRQPALAADRIVEAGAGGRDQLVPDDHLGERPRAAHRLRGPLRVSGGADGGLRRHEARPGRRGPRRGQPGCRAPPLGRRCGARPGPVAWGPRAEAGGSRYRSGARGGRGAISSRVWAMSTEPMPSIMQWWVLVTTAQCPSASSSTTISQSGLVRSSRCE